MAAADSGRPVARVGATRARATATRDDLGLLFIITVFIEVVQDVSDHWFGVLLRFFG